jgi:uncharacterized phage infection (PIP) family protein YhgE
MMRAGDAGESGGGEGGWRRKRTSQINRLEEGFDKLVGLIETIDRGLRQQAERSDESISQMRRIAESLSQSQAVGRQQAETLHDLGIEARNQTRQLQQVAEAVDALPKSISNQSEQLAKIRDQLEAQLEAQLSTAQGMQQLAAAADGLRNVAKEQRDQFASIHQANQEASMKIVETVNRQTRRFTWLMASVLALTVASTVAAVAAIWALVRAGG